MVHQSLALAVVTDLGDDGVLLAIPPERRRSGTGEEPMQRADLGVGAARWGLGCFVVMGVLAGCGEDGDDTAADRVGVAAQCSSDAECPAVERGDVTVQLTCLREFKGGYCSISACERNDDCPDGSECVNHDDGNSYCFRVCSDKAECNRNRSLENEANCSSSIDLTDADSDSKACVPPSSGV
jgi:hypothetical protein